MQVLEHLLLSEGVHACPETVVLIRKEPAFSGQPLERTIDEFVSSFHVVKYRVSKNEEPAIHQQSAVLDVLDRSYAAALLDLDNGEAADRVNTCEARDRLRLALERSDHVRQR